MNRYTPTAAEIAAVQRDTGMGHIQARNNLICREHARRQYTEQLRNRVDAVRSAWCEMKDGTTGGVK